MTFDFHPEVPSQVQHQHHYQNGVHVKGGTNWDLSRSAVATPIARLPDPQPVKPVAVESVRVATAKPDASRYLPVEKFVSVEPSAMVTFKANAAGLNNSAKKTLSELPKNVRLIVAGHADPAEAKAPAIAKQRAAAVAKYLKTKGKKPVSVQSFADEFSLESESHEKNRRVEVFIAK